MPAPPRDPQRSVDDVVSSIFNIAGRPVRSVAEFYALYWLAEIEADPDVQLEWRFRRNQIRDGLYWYTVYALLSELSTGWTHYYIGGDSLATLQSQDIIRGHASELSRESAERHGLGSNARTILTARFERFFLNMGTFRQVRGPDIESVRNALRLAERRFGSPGNPIRDPHQFIEHIELFFGVTPSPPLNPTEFGDEQATGWLPQYNGDAWTAIAEHARRLGDGALPDTSWIDQTWAIEHNNSNFLDKIDATPAERRSLADIRGAVFGEDTGPDFTDAVVRKFLIELLDAARASDMSLVFTYAVHFDTDSDVDFRQKAEQYDINVWTSDPIPVTFTDTELAALREFGRVYRGWPGSRHDIWDGVGAVPSQHDISELAHLVQSAEEQMGEEVGRVTIEQPEATWRQHRGVVEFAYRYTTDAQIRQILADANTAPMRIRQTDVLRQLDGKLTQAVGMRT